MTIQHLSTGAVVAAALLATSVVADGSIPGFKTDPNTTKFCSFWYDNQGSSSCQDIVADFVSGTMEDFLRWNPSITPSCGNFQPNQSYCIEARGEPKPTTSTSKQVKTSTTTSTTSTSTTTKAPTTTKPSNGINTPSPTMPKMVDNCDRFAYVKTGDTCEVIANAAGISLADFYSWNPAVGSQCGNLQANVYVCTHIIDGPSPTTAPPSDGTPRPTQPGMTSGCNKFYKVKAGDGCPRVASDNGIPLSVFYDWNPAVKSDCTNLLADVYVCVGKNGYVPPPASTKPSNGIQTPSPTYGRMADDCTSFYKVQPGDGCYQLAQDQRINLSDFYAWNPDVGTDCRGLQANVYVCTGVAAFHVRSRYHSDCSGDVHNDNVVRYDDGPCINTDCQVASMEILAAGAGACPNGQVQISYWEKPNCQGQWFGYGYTSTGTCRRLWTDGYKWKSLHLRCAKKEDDCVSRGNCKADPEPDHNIC